MIYALGNLGIHVCAVHVDLAAGFMNDTANLADGFFEDAMGRRIRDHQRAEFIAVLADPFAQIRNIDVPTFITIYGNASEARDHRTRSVRAVRRNGDQANISFGFITRLVVAADREESCVFTLGASIRLKRNRRQARNLSKPGLELLE